MPFPWKKAKGTRFSRLVADLHQSPKRGGSLVVETGFPTSLVDLFVKNRDRLRKPTKRKPTSSQIQTPPTTTHQPPSPPQSSPSSTRNEELQSPRIDVGNKLVLVNRESQQQEEAEEETVACHAAFKFLLVVALAFCARNLALWIMLVAFLLMLTEFVWTRFLRPESKGVFWDSWVPNGLSVLNRLDKKLGSSAAAAEELVVKREATVSLDPCGMIELEDDCVEEIEIAESESESESLKTEMKVEEEMTETSIREILTCEAERSRRARIKRTLVKKFVPKKLRQGRKQWKSNNKDESCS
ncbi:hypothetical protein PTKIN_Ptkin13bG0156800 [Pterospermum kingtungense]